MGRKQNLYPPVKIEKLHQSAQKFQLLMTQASLLINKINSSSTFAHELIDAAQQSNKKKVEELIQSTGLSIPVISHFNPDGIIFELSNAENGKGCCTLHIALQW
ncbi:hypothetical protein ACA30_21675 [Virgibacillus soli]|uniref:Uncharacterized protein n=2 Tax=Lederbergia galactosidilytica TaxID=217031 RepID=A0A0Q9Y5A7_9BACI|nr:hypothetical protein [Lederbergia galactosidilytica]KRG09673.1 hypothetical protein ACA30_21675 [Virgibacillus soli]KRG12228.1 hypothetical protein ACA29_11660 [Lederbergia galactosidilytica]OAK75834.1 hypothetical protein ABB05_00345 [Lederbergia galactosidilytica]